MISESSERGGEEESPLLNDVDDSKTSTYVSNCDFFYKNSFYNTLFML